MHQVMDTQRYLEREKKGAIFWSAGRYYDHPDGKDLVGKLMYTNKIAGLVGSIFSVSHVMYYPPVPKDTKGRCLRFLQCSLPFLGMATIFTTVTFVSTNIRKKDDTVNYVLGGLAAGLFLIPVTKQVSFGVLAALSFATAGYFKKNAQMHGTVLFPHLVKKQKSPYYERLFDTSLEPDTRRGNWTK